MNHYQLIADNFQSTIETIAMSADMLAEAIERGSQLMSNCLIGDHKIIACGNGVDAVLAQLFVSYLINRVDLERPALPALSLSGDSATLSAIAHSSSLHDSYSRALRALGQPGDVLLCISSANGASNLLRAVQAAHDRDMAVIALSNPLDVELGALLASEDVELSVPGPTPARVVEIHTLVIHNFCQLIEYSLFGGHDAE